MTAAWLQQKERGSFCLMRFIAWLSLNAGSWLGRALLYPICVYFLASSRRSRRVSAQYLAAALGRKPRLRDVFRHHHAFASVILDRVFFLAGRLDRYEIDIVGHEILQEWQAKGRGCILLGAHLGSFEVLRAVGISRSRLAIKAMMHRGNSPRLDAVLDALNPEIADSIIPLGTPASMLAARDWVAKGGMVALLGDRAATGERCVAVDFLGRPAAFPVGPFLLASLLGVPVVLFFGLYRGRGRYEIRFELLADRLGVDRATREREILLGIERYASRLQHYCRDEPFNWFNFYDFWQEAEHLA